MCPTDGWIIKSFKKEHIIYIDSNSKLMIDLTQKSFFAKKIGN